MSGDRIARLATLSSTKMVAFICLLCKCINSPHFARKEEKRHVQYAALPIIPFRNSLGIDFSFESKVEDTYR
jgi:hypothetical protein